MRSRCEEMRRECEEMRSICEELAQKVRKTSKSESKMAHFAQKWNRKQAFLTKKGILSHLGGQNKTE